MTQVMSESQSDRAIDDRPAVGPPLRAGQYPPAIALFLGVALAVLAGDLLLKYVAFHQVAGQPVVMHDDPRQTVIPPHEPVRVIPGVLNLHLTTNTGAVFGLGRGYRWAFIVVSVIAAGVILYLFWRSSSRAWLLHLALALILAGALGNLYDRIRYAAVRDMLHLFPEAGLWPWIFNLADAALMLGVGLMLVISFSQERRKRKALSGLH